MPWLSKNSAMKRAGKVHIWRGSADHTAEAWGTIRRSMKGRLKRCCSSHWPSEGPSPSPVSPSRSARAARLKRAMSATMR